jgi:hypothetical protein
MPQDTDLISALMPPDAPLALGYPDDPLNPYAPAPPFRKEEVIETVAELQSDHSVRIAQCKEYAHFLDCGTPGTFEEDADDIADGIIETMPLLGAREDYEMRVGFLATHDPYPRLLNRDLIERDEAIAVEDLVTYDFQCEERQYARQHRADLSIARAHHLLRYGMLVGIDVLDPDAPNGLSSDLLDPLTLFPVWGGPGRTAGVLSGLHRHQRGHHRHLWRQTRHAGIRPHPREGGEERYQDRQWTAQAHGPRRGAHRHRRLVL